MPRIVLITIPRPHTGRAEVLRRVLGPDVELVYRYRDLRTNAHANISAVIQQLENAGGKVIAVVLPRWAFRELGRADAFGPGVWILREDYWRNRRGGLVISRYGTGHGDTLLVWGYSRLMHVDERWELLKPGQLKAQSGQVLVISRNSPIGRQEALDSLFARPMRLEVINPRFAGNPRQVIARELGSRSRVDAVVVPPPIVDDLRFGDVFGSVYILAENCDRDANGQLIEVSRSAEGMPIHRVVSLSRFICCEITMGSVCPPSKKGTGT